MTHKFTVGDTLKFEDHRSRFARAVDVVVTALVHEPTDSYMVKAPHTLREFPAFEDELWRPQVNA